MMKSLIDINYELSILSDYNMSALALIRSKQILQTVENDLYHANALKHPELIVFCHELIKERELYLTILN